MDCQFKRSLKEIQRPECRDSVWEALFSAKGHPNSASKQEHYPERKLRPKCKRNTQKMEGEIHHAIMQIDSSTIDKKREKNLWTSLWVNETH